MPVMRPWGAAPAVIVIALGLLLSGRGLGVSGEAAVSLPPEAAQVARDFLFAFSRNDRDRIQTMLPKRLENLYGPCPFARMPELRNPRADTRAAAIDFEGPMADTGLPNKGIIMLRLVEEEGRRGWRVRQIYWYQKLPPEAEIPERSATPADRAQEPLVRQAAEEFLGAWLASNYERMDGLTFHWWEAPRRPPKWVKMNGAELSARPTSLEGLRVDFVVRLRVLKVISKDVRGNLWLVQEDGAWKVRPLTFTFAF